MDFIKLRTKKTKQNKKVLIHQRKKKTKTKKYLNQYNVRLGRMHVSELVSHGRDFPGYK